MTVQQPLPVQHPSVWTATQQKSKPEEWCYQLVPADLAEIDAALKRVQHEGLVLTVRPTTLAVCRALISS